MTTKISIVNVKDYDTIPDAIVAAIKMIEKDLEFNFLECKSILLKPNLLRATRDACTQPIFVEGIIKYLKESGVRMENVSIGDSPGQIKVSATYIAKKIGLYDVCEKAGIKFMNFEHDIPVHEKIQDSIRLHDYYVSKSVKDCDLLINLPKLKTHGEATITGAIKNYWGVIPGGLKAKYHLVGNTPDKFGEALADNYSWIVKNKPNRLTIYDCVRIMEGPMGPVSGYMKQWDLILVGTDEVALDVVALEIGKYKGSKYVPHLKNASERGLGEFKLDNIEILGVSLDEARRTTPKFKVPGRRMTRFASFITRSIVYKVTKKIPSLKKKLCVQCGQCSEICPANAIDFEDGSYPQFLRRDCISCLCCMEMCPQEAIKPKLRGFGGLFHSY
ncbi:MAG: DUF362 domain-containing protein [Promethearchaeota archaeon]|jgi:uncharacterized protein (DUF362 family)/NAD-dependent dihydropyrimidine dehydrogenase PreA subunit